MVQGRSSNRDLVSELPDDILRSILQYLTVSEGVKTSVLSRRWRYLSASLSHLQFDLCNIFPQNKPPPCPEVKQKFVKAVNQLLKQHKAPSISSFRLCFCLDRNNFASDVDGWVSYAVKMGVEQLIIRCSCDRRCNSEDYEPKKLYTLSCEQLSGVAYKLKHLELKACVVKPDFKGQFHSLKFLNLLWAPMNQNLLDYILSTCLSLEQMGLDGCVCSAVLSFHGPSSMRLTHLSVSHCEGLKKIKLSAINLTNFNLSFFLMENVEFCHVPKLESVSWNLIQISASSNKLANQVPQLQCLSVSTSPVLIDYMHPVIGIFSNLKQLEFYLLDRFYRDIGYQNIITLINACPVLQKFHLTCNWIMRANAKDHLQEESVTKEGQKWSNTQLKEVEINGFYGTANQLELASYLLKNAVALELMVLRNSFSNWEYADPLDQGERKVKSFFSRWKYSDPLLKEDRQWIIQQLQGKAISKSAQVIVSMI